MKRGGCTQKGEGGEGGGDDAHLRKETAFLHRSQMESAAGQRAQYILCAVGVRVGEAIKGCVCVVRRVTVRAVRAKVWATRPRPWR